jgi:hypothetical protein
VRHNPRHATDDELVVRQIIAANPWVQNVIDHLRAPGPYRQPHLADDMERTHDAGIGCPTDISPRSTA